MLRPCPPESRNGSLAAKSDTTSWGCNGAAPGRVLPWKFGSVPEKGLYLFKIWHHPQQVIGLSGVTTGTHPEPEPSPSAFARRRQTSVPEGSIPATTTALWTLRKFDRISSSS